MSNVTKLLTDIDLKPLHPKNKIVLYSRYVLSKLSWHLTIADLSKTWISENLDPIVNQHIRKWLEIPISGTLSNVYLNRNKFGLNIIPPSTKFVQCQSTIRNTLKSSTNQSIIHLWKSTHNHTNMQYDQTRQRNFSNHFVKIKKTNLTINCCTKDHSSQVFPNFRCLK